MAGRAMWAAFWFQSVFLVHYTGFRKEKQNWDIVPLTKAPLVIAWQTEGSVWSCEDEAVIAWQTFESAWSCEAEAVIAWQTSVFCVIL